MPLATRRRSRRISNSRCLRVGAVRKSRYQCMSSPHADGARSALVWARTHTTHGLLQFACAKQRAHTLSFAAAPTGNAARALRGPWRGVKEGTALRSAVSTDGGPREYSAAEIPTPYMRRQRSKKQTRAGLFSAASSCVTHGATCAARLQPRTEGPTPVCDRTSSSPAPNGPCQTNVGDNERHTHATAPGSSLRARCRRR